MPVCIAQLSTCGLCFRYYITWSVGKNPDSSSSQQSTLVVSWRSISCQWNTQQSNLSYSTERKVQVTWKQQLAAQIKKTTVLWKRGGRVGSQWSWGSGQIVSIIGAHLCVCVCVCVYAGACKSCSTRVVRTVKPVCNGLLWMTSDTRIIETDSGFSNDDRSFDECHDNRAVDIANDKRGQHAVLLP
jgi:hypothetical protein